MQESIKKTEQKGVYQPVSDPIKYVTLKDDIVFMAPWGEEMFGVKGAALNVSNLDDIYVIQNEAFNKIYSEYLEKNEDIENS